MITERTLRKWRRDALNTQYYVDTAEVTKTNQATVISLNAATEMKERILRLTQELMDILLMRKG